MYIYIYIVILMKPFSQSCTIARMAAYNRCHSFRDHFPSSFHVIIFNLPNNAEIQFADEELFSTRLCTFLK